MPIGSVRRVLRQVRRIALVLALVLVVLVLGAIAFVHTPLGREIVRREIESQVAATFTGGATIGGYEGSPFTSVVLKDVAINAPDGKSVAIRVGTLRVGVRLWSLLDKDVKVTRLAADDVDVRVGADFGQLVKPTPPSPGPSTWSVDAPSVVVTRGHVAIDRGGEPIDLDGLAIGAGAWMHAGATGTSGGSVAVAGTWRQRAGAPIAVLVHAMDDGVRADIPALVVRAGDVLATGEGVRIERYIEDAQSALIDPPGTEHPDELPKLAGRLTVIAPKAGVAALAPNVVLPDDVTLKLAVLPDGAREQLALDGTLGPTPIRMRARADLMGRAITGRLKTGELDLARLSNDAVAGVAAISHAHFAATLPDDDAPPGTLPIAELHAIGHAAVSGAPGGVFAIEATSGGKQAALGLSLIGQVQAVIAASAMKDGDRIVLEQSSIVASSHDVVNGVTGNFALAIGAHGQLAPELDVEARGNLTGTAVKAKALSAGSIRIDLTAARKGVLTRGDVTIKASHVAADPRAPLSDVTAHITAAPGRATATVDATMVANGSIPNAAAEPDNSIAPAQKPIPATNDAGKVSGSPGTSAPTGTKRDNAPANTKTAGWANAKAGTHTTVAKVSDKAVVPAKDDNTKQPANAASTSGREHVKIAVDIVAPQRIEDVAAWKARGRDALRTLDLQLSNIDLARLAQLAQPSRYKHDTRFDSPPASPPIRGRLDGDVHLTPTTASGKITVKNAGSPMIRGIKAFDVELAFAEPKGRELAPQLTVVVPQIGTATARARIALPARLFDAPAWQRAGLKLVREAELETTQIAVDPAFWDRFQIASTLRGRVKVTAKVDAGLDGVTVEVAGDDVRGTPLAQPVAIAAKVAFVGKVANAQLALTTKQGKSTLVHVDAKVPVSFAELRTGGAAALQAAGSRPLVATIELPKTDAKALMNVFGHSEVTQGVLDGKIAIAGTLAHPTATVHITGEGVGVPPGPRGKPVQMLDHIAIDGTYDAAQQGKITIVGRENAGGTLNATITGNAHALLAGRATIEAHHFDLGPMLAFAPGPAGGSRGTLDAKLAVAGFDPRTAHVLGEVHLARARMPIAPTVGTLRDAQIDILLREHDIGLKTTGKLGAGTVKLDGKIALDKGVDLGGGEIAIELRKVSPIGAIEPVVDADITTKLTRNGAKWTADIVVDHGVVKITGKQGEAIKPSANPADLVIAKGGKLPPPPPKAPPRAVHPSTKPEAPPPPAQPSLVANITLRTTRVESDEVRATIGGKLAITADTKTIGMVGQISANPAGEVTLFDRRYQIERANVVFDGTIDPMLDVSITHDFPDVTTMTQVRGRLSKPELVLTSVPASYSQSELLGFVLGGEPGGDPNAASARDKLTGAGESFIAGRIGAYVKKALPFDIDVIKYEAAGVDSSAAITVGSWLTHSLFFAFREHIDARPDENTGEGTLEYFFTKRFEIQGTAGDRNFDAIDFLWRRRF